MMRRGLPQLLARSAVVFHIEENEAAQIARLMVVGVDAQCFVDEFESLVQPVLAPVEFRCGEQRSRLGRCKPNQLLRMGFSILETIHCDRRIDHLYEAVPVIGFHVEYGLSLPDRLLELVELEQNIGSETAVGGLCAVNGDGPVDGGECFLELPELEQNIGPEAGVSGIFAVNGDGPVDGGECFLELPELEQNIGPEAAGVSGVFAVNGDGPVDGGECFLELSELEQNIGPEAG